MSLSVSAYGDIDNIEHWPDEALRSWQAERLTEVVEWARDRVPFYRTLWSQAGLGDIACDSIEDVRQFPIINKQSLIDAGSEWVAGSLARVGFSTRGTSGEPLVVWLSAEEEDVYIVPTIRGFRWAGFEKGQTALLMSPVWHRLAACESHAVVRMGGRCAFFWGSLGLQFAGEFLSTLRTARPDFLTTTAPFILALVKYGEENGLPLPDLFRSVRAIVAVGLPLTPRTREYIRDRLGVSDVFERGGTQEGAAIDECRFHEFGHVHEDVCYLEILDSSGRPVAHGERGRLVVTKLTPTGSIFVRYDTGDIAAFAAEPCRCGCTFRRLKIFGRPESSVEVSGRMITAYDVRLCVENDPALVGRNVLLIRPEKRSSGTLSIAIEGVEHDTVATRSRLCEQFGVGDARVVWLGSIRVAWGFRQVIDGREVGLGS